MKRTITIFIALLILLSMVGCAKQVPSVSMEEYNKIIAERDSLSAQLGELQGEKSALQTRYDTLIAENSKLENSNSELQDKIDSASAWFELSDEEQSDMLVVLQERESAREAQAAKEAQQGYETGITYAQLARTPDDYTGKKVKFTGFVLQVVEGDAGTTVVRLATRGRYDDIILVHYASSITDTRVLEDDKITIFGISGGLYTYQSTMGGDITIPYVIVEQLEFASK